MQTKLKAGDVVKYSSPEAGEENDRFTVLEAHYGCIPERVKIQVIDMEGDFSPALLPVSSVSPSEVILAQP